MTEENCNDVFNNGKVSYNFDTNTLTLNGYSYSGNCTERNKGRNGVIHYTGTGTETLTIVVNGSNTLINDPPEGTTAYGIYVKDANLTIQGSGTLDVIANGNNAVSTCGIFAGKTLTISGNCTINAEAIMDSDGESNRIYYWYAIGADTLNMTGGTVTATANNHPNKDGSYALIIDTISITGGSFTAKGYRAVCSRTPNKVSFGNGVTAVVSKDYEGTGTTDYQNSDSLSSNKYFHAST